MLILEAYDMNFAEMDKSQEPHINKLIQNH